MGSKDNYLLFFDNIDMKEEQYIFWYIMAIQSYNYGRYFSIYPVYDKTVYMKLLEINSGAKIIGFNRTKILYDQQREIYHRLIKCK
jgi:hypothetical protein